MDNYGIPSIPPTTRDKLKLAADEARRGHILNSEQLAVLHAVLAGRSVFFTGSAGTGKSFVLERIIERLRERYGSDEAKLAVTASTGIAGYNIGGTTVHSFAGIGLGKNSVALLVKDILKQRGPRERWRQVQTLIIDEISMLDAGLFGKLEAVARGVRGNEQQWGGIQLVVAGDFYQLPPVEGDLAFKAQKWGSSFDDAIELREVRRQADPAFIRILGRLRVGKLTAPTIAAIRALSRELQLPPGLKPVSLRPLVSEADDVNAEELSKLKGPSRVYDAEDVGDPRTIDKLTRSPRRLELRIGAQVMLVRNIDGQLVNGSTGVVVRFTDDDAALPCVRFVSGDELTIGPMEWKSDGRQPQMSRYQLPFILAWAVTIHKSQGQTLAYATVDLGNAFADGQVYVALSRAKSMDGLQVTRFNPAKIQPNTVVDEFYRKLHQQQN